MTRDKLRQLIAGASRDVLRLSSQELARAGVDAIGSRKATKLERSFGHGALGKVQTQRRNTGRFLVRVTSIRKRLLDEDNLCEKYHVDCCRYAGLLPGDAPGTTKIEVAQQKTEPGAQEETRIEIFKL